jgi:hypothetical protein
MSSGGPGIWPVGRTLPARSQTPASAWRNGTPDAPLVAAFRRRPDRPDQSGGRGPEWRLPLGEPQVVQRRVVEVRYLFAREAIGGTKSLQVIGLRRGLDELDGADGSEDGSDETDVADSGAGSRSGACDG